MPSARWKRVPAAGIDASLRLFEYYREHVARAKARPADDLTTALLSVEDGGDRMTEGEVVAFLFLMVVAGNETTTKLLGNAVYWLPVAKQRDLLTAESRVLIVAADGVLPLRPRLVEPLAGADLTDHRLYVSLIWRYTHSGFLTGKKICAVLPINVRRAGSVALGRSL